METKTLKPKRRIKTKHSAFSIILLIVVLTFGLASYIFLAVFRPNNDDYVLPKYSTEVVYEICSIFEIDVEDNFCSQPSIQDADTFREMLHQNYPREETYYNDIVPKLRHIRSKPTHNCESPVTTDFGWAVNNCPPPNECNNGKPTYTCTFSLTLSDQNIGVDIFFHQSTGIIGGYGVTRPSASAPEQ